MKAKNKPLVFNLLASILLFQTGISQPTGGDLYREYIWLPSMVREQEKFLRVGGNLDYRIAPEHMPPGEHLDGQIPLRHPVDLEQAVRAEVTLEFVQSHEDTKGLSIRFNGGDWIKVPEFGSIPRPQSDYIVHCFPTAKIPLSSLNGGDNNRFELRVNPEQRWNWPQNLLYGLILRVYYQANKIADRSIEIGGLKAGGGLSESQEIYLEKVPVEPVERVDYFAKYLDFNWEGDGVYFQWHGHTHKGVLRNHLGEATLPPYTLVWNTSWVPDQNQGISIRARVKYRNGLYRMSEATEDLHLERHYSVELCRPYHQPKNWVTRKDTMEASFSIEGSLEDAVAYQVGWRSWSPCYGRGLWINDAMVWHEEEPCYGYAEHLLERTSTGDLHRGENLIRTGMTPLIEGKMVHGMEVQYPGIMVKVKYSKPAPGNIQISEAVYEGRPHFLITTPSATYYYDKAGGGFSRMLDPDGIDWIDFRMEPWGKYPEAAAGAYRGIPNLVYGAGESGAGHPGHNQCTSTVVDSHTIRTESHSGQWLWEWTFFPSYARLSILKSHPVQPYWFLYEGTPGGRFDPENQYFGHDHAGPSSATPDYFQGDRIFQNWQWFYCGSRSSDYALYLLQRESDRLSDTFSYLGHSELGIKSTDGMVVFGFGRAEGAIPLLTKPQQFIIGFFPGAIRDRNDHEKLRSYIETLTH